MVPKVNESASISKGLLIAHNTTKMKKLEAVWWYDMTNCAAPTQPKW